LNVVPLIQQESGLVSRAPSINTPAIHGLWLRVILLLALGYQAGLAVGQEGPSALEEVTVTATLLQGGHYTGQRHGILGAIAASAGCRASGRCHHPRT